MVYFDKETQGIERTTVIFFFKAAWNLEMGFLSVAVCATLQQWGATLGLKIQEWRNSRLIQIKIIADNKINMTEKFTIVVIWKGRKILRGGGMEGKGENAGNQHTLLFQHFLVKPTGSEPEIVITTSLGCVCIIVLKCASI